MRSHSASKIPLNWLASGHLALRLNSWTVVATLFPYLILLTEARQHVRCCCLHCSAYDNMVDVSEYRSGDTVSHCCHFTIICLLGLHSVIPQYTEEAAWNNLQILVCLSNVNLCDKSLFNIRYFSSLALNVLIQLITEAIWAVSYPTHSDHYTDLIYYRCCL